MFMQKGTVLLYLKLGPSPFCIKERIPLRRKKENFYP